MNSEPIESVGPGPAPESVARTATFANPLDATLRNPNYFVPGELYRHAENWKAIPEARPEILKFVVDKVNAWDLLVPFQGEFDGKVYNSQFPPQIEFQNNRSCVGFESFITDTILQRVKNGSLKFWGRVNKVKPPHLVMPITIEPQKPRMCHDERFLNLWVKDLPFKLDHLSDLPRYVKKDIFKAFVMIKVDTTILCSLRTAIRCLVSLGWDVISYTAHCRSAGKPAPSSTTLWD